MTRNKRLLAMATCTVLALGGAAACTSDAKTASDNLSKAADNFEVYRRVTFYNSIRGENIMVIEGWCSVDLTDPNKQSVICKVGGSKDNPVVVRNGMSKSDNVFCSYVQLQATGVSADHYRVILDPKQVIPDIQMN
jgi:hypothetical protein